MSSTASPLTAPTEPTPEAVLALRLRGSLLAEELREIADRPENAHYKSLLYSAINSILIEAARTPEKDRRRLLDALKWHGGGTVRDIAEQAKLPASDARQTLEQLCAAGLVVRRSRGEQRGADSLLFFLKDDLNALDFRPA